MNNETQPPWIVDAPNGGWQDGYRDNEVLPAIPASTIIHNHVHYYHQIIIVSYHINCYYSNHHLLICKVCHHPKLTIPVIAFITNIIYNSFCHQHSQGYSLLWDNHLYHYFHIYLNQLTLLSLTLLWTTSYTITSYIITIHNDFCLNH